MRSIFSAGFGFLICVFAVLALFLLSLPVEAGCRSGNGIFSRIFAGRHARQSSQSVQSMSVRSATPRASACAECEQFQRSHAPASQPPAKMPKSQ